MPSYQGGDEALYDFIHENIQYPKEALGQKKEGTVQMRVIIDEQGNVSQTKVMRGICTSLDEEAQRVISSTSGRWICGKVDDKPVKTYKYLRVSYKIDTTASEPTIAAPLKSAIAFIGGDEAFYNFIRKNIKIPNALFFNPNLWGPVTVSAAFNSLNKITDVVLIKGPYKELNEEGIRLTKLSQGNWMRTDSNNDSKPITTAIIIPFSKSMVDSSVSKKAQSVNIILRAYNSNPIFKRAYDNYKLRNYDLALPDLNYCVNNKTTVNAARAVRAYCYLALKNYSEACTDLQELRFVSGMDHSIEDLYYKYCMGSNKDNQNMPHRVTRPVYQPPPPLRMLNN